MPKSNTRDALGQLALLQALGDLAAEAVVAQPGVADAGDEDLLPRSCGSTSLVEEEQEAAGLAQQLLRRVVVDRHAEVEAVVVRRCRIRSMVAVRAVEHPVVRVAAVRRASTTLSPGGR